MTHPTKNLIIRDTKLATAIRQELKLDVPKDAPLRVQDLERLSFLQAKYRKIVDLTGLQHATNLRKLYLEVNNIEDISALENLTKLETLDLRWNNIDDFSALENLLENLLALDLESNNIEDLSALEDFEEPDRHPMCFVRLKNFPLVTPRQQQTENN